MCCENQFKQFGVASYANRDCKKLTGWWSPAHVMKWIEKNSKYRSGNHGPSRDTDWIDPLGRPRPVFISVPWAPCIPVTDKRFPFRFLIFYCTSKIDFLLVFIDFH